jgi:hypothetical protein
MVEISIIVIITLLIIRFGLTICLLTIFRVIKIGLSIFNPKYYIVRIVITLISALPSINTSCKIDPLHYISMITLYSRLVAMVFKGVDTFGILSVDNPFFNSFRANDTIATNCLMVMSAFYDSTSFTSK